MCRLGPVRNTHARTAAEQGASRHARRLTSLNRARENKSKGICCCHKVSIRVEEWLAPPPAEGRRKEAVRAKHEFSRRIGRKPDPMGSVIKKRKKKIRKHKMKKLRKKMRHRK